MNTINKWALGMAFVMGLASCEMKEEIWGNDPISGDTGLLDLNIATTSSKNQISTKGTTDQVEEFPVTITGKDVDYNLSFASFAKLKEENPLTLPVGTFTIEAHSPGEFEDVMTEPYYGGTKEITIAKSTTTQDSISCTIQNVKISLDLTSSFLETYGEWEITVTDNNGHVKVYKNTDEDAEEPASIYWKLGDDVEIIYIKGSATTKDGQETVTINSSAKKSDLQEYEEGENTSFVGGDELVLSFTPVKVEGSTPGVEKDGIEITISGFNTETNKDITIDINPGTDEPGESGDTEEPGDTEDSNAISISDGGTGCLTNAVTIKDGKASGDVKVIMDVPNGIKNILVRIDGTDDFESMMKNDDSMMKLVSTEGLDLANLTPQESEAFAKLFDLPEVQNTEYTFTMSDFLFTLMSTFVGTQHFYLTVKDMAEPENSSSAVLTIIVE